MLRVLLRIRVVGANPRKFLPLLIGDPVEPCRGAALRLGHGVHSKKAPGRRETHLVPSAFGKEGIYGVTMDVDGAGPIVRPMVRWSNSRPSTFSQRVLSLALQVIAVAPENDRRLSPLSLPLPKPWWSIPSPGHHLVVGPHTLSFPFVRSDVQVTGQPTRSGLRLASVQGCRGAENLQCFQSGEKH